MAYFTSVCQGKSTKAPDKCSPIGELLWGTIFHALGMIFRLFRGIFVRFWRWDRVFRGLFPIFPAFSIRQNAFPSQKSGKSDGNAFFQIVIMPKATGTRFRRWEHVLTVCKCTKVEIINFQNAFPSQKMLKWAKPGRISSSQGLN